MFFQKLFFTFTTIFPLGGSNRRSQIAINITLYLFINSSDYKRGPPIWKYGPPASKYGPPACNFSLPTSY